MKFVLSKAIDGTMQLKAHELAQQNRKAFCQKVGITYEKIVAGQLVNSNNIAVVGDSDAGTIKMATDGLITASKNVFLSITVADCLPVILYSPDKVVALLHSGWRGLDLGIIGKAVKIMGEMGVKTNEIMAEVGPGIESHHYSVGPEVAVKFGQITGVVTQKEDVFYLDLKTVAKHQLMELGIGQIQTSPVCTFCDESHYSARRDQKEPVEAMMAIVSLS